MTRRSIKRLVATLLLVLMGSYGAWQAWRKHVGAPQAALAERWFESRQTFDRHGALLRDEPSVAGHRGHTLALEDMGERLLLATLAAEDQHFFAHGGIDSGALLRAIGQNLRHGRTVSGASTVTQQLVKLLEHRGEPSRRTLSTKLWEAARAQNLESELTKGEILEAYMNRLPYGRGWVGPDAAAHAYFGVRSRQLSWAQASFLAVLPRAPSYLDPFHHRDRVVKRQRQLLTRLHALGVLDASELARAQREPLQLRTTPPPFDAPAWVERLRHREDRPPRMVTTLDLGLQKDVEGLVRTHLSAFAEQHAYNAAVLVVDNQSGDVLAYVGSADFGDSSIDGQVDMIAARRQPGSTLKPFVYALAFEAGVSPVAMLADVPTTFREGPGEVYAPQNFHRGFVGPIAAREALAASLNVPAIRLASDLGPGELLQRLRALGLQSLDRDASHYGLALALGSGEVRLDELAAAYVALARDGQAIDLRFVASDPPPLPRPVLSPTVATAITEALSDPMPRIRLLGGHGSPFNLGFDVALKTGTSSGLRDAWTLGYTRERTVAVWIGNADGSAMLDVTGSSGAGPLFADVMRRAMRALPPAPLVTRAHLRIVDVCPLSGLVPGPSCPSSVSRRVPADHDFGAPCAVHHHADPPRDATGVHRCDPGGRERIAVLPPVFDAWLQTRPQGAPGHAPDDIPWIASDQTEHCATEVSRYPTLVVEEPQAGAVFWVRGGDPSDGVALRARYEGPADQRPPVIEWVVDDQVQGRSAEPYATTLVLPPGDHRVYVRPARTDHPVRMPSVTFAVRE